MVETFLGVGRPTGSSEVVVLGAELATVYRGREPHATGGPAAIRAASGRLAPFVGNHDFDIAGPFAPWTSRVADGGDITTIVTDPEGNRERISSAVGQVVGDGAMPILLGGDDSVAIPFLAAWRERGPITVVQVDAHLDFRDDVDGERYGYSSPMRRGTEMDWIDRVIHVGQRGVGSARPGDVDDSLAAGNTIITARDLARMGPASVAERLEPRQPFVIVYDVDGTDPSQIPAVRAPSAGGPGIDMISELFGALASHGRLAGLVVTEFEPALDPTGASARSLVRLVCRALDGRFSST